VLGLGMGGEWTSGAALVSESWPDAHRGKAIGLMQSAWAVGYAAAAVVAAIVLPRFGWRGTFLVGLAPALLVLWIRKEAPESPAWIARRAAGAPPAPMRALFSPPLLAATVALSALSLFTLVAYWALNLWMAAYLSLPTAQGGLAFVPAVVTALVVSMQVGTWFGYVSFGYICDAIGRRTTFIAFLIVGAALVFMYGRTSDPRLLFALGPLAAFFGTGHLAGFGVVAAELYPTSIRATAQGLTFNIGRVGSALAPFTVGSLAETHGFGPAFTLTAVSLLAAAGVWIWLPETKGRCLQ
jgi:MFS family permease